MVVGAERLSYGHHVDISLADRYIRRMFLERKYAQALLVMSGKHGHTGTSEPGRSLGGKIRVVDRPRIDSIKIRAKKLHPFLEKRSLLLVRQGEGCVDVDLRGIGLNLAEIRIIGGFQNDIGSKSVLAAD